MVEKNLNVTLSRSTTQAESEENKKRNERAEKIIKGTLRVPLAIPFWRNATDAVQLFGIEKWEAMEIALAVLRAMAYDDPLGGDLPSVDRYLKTGEAPQEWKQRDPMW